MSYTLHRIIEYIAREYQVDSLKSGLYFTGKDKQEDRNINYVVWFYQLIIWCMIILLVKFFIFAL